MMGGMLGACHALELGFVFGTHGEPGMADFSGSGPAADALSERMMDAWLAFAKSGDPSTRERPGALHRREIARPRSSASAARSRARRTTRSAARGTPCRRRCSGAI